MAGVQQVVLCPRVYPFHFRWTIEHFSILCEKEELVTSQFVVDGPKRSKWMLRLNPRGMHEDSGHFSVFLVHIPYKEDERVKVSFHLKIQSESGDDYCKTEYGYIHEFSKDAIFSGDPNLITLEDLMNGKSDLLPNDVLTVICQGKILLDNTKPKNLIPIRGPDMSNDISKMLTVSTGKDITLVAKGKTTFLVHKFMLCARSPVFAAKFKSKTPESKSGKVLMKDFSPDVVRGIVNFMYTDKLPEEMTNDLAMNLTSAAVMYQMRRLESLCEVHLSNSMKVQNVIEILGFAIRKGISKLKEICMKFINTNRKDMVDSQVLKDCTGDVEVMRGLIDFQIMGKEFI